MIDLDLYNNIKGKGIKIAIIDSGLNINHSKIDSNKITNGYHLKYDEISDNIIISSDINDSIGHGTAIYKIIETLVPDAEITIIKIFDNELTINQTAFEKIMQYIVNNFEFHVINLSLGVVECESTDNLYSVCNNITEKGTIIVSAFDNLGAISFPAAFDNVIGVDISYSCNKKWDFEYISNSIINIKAKGALQRVYWTDPEYIMAGGSSFACGYVTAYVVKFMQQGIYKFCDILNEFKSIAIKKHIDNTSLPNNCNIQRIQIKKAIIFPFNKEMHALVRYSDMLNFEIVDVYDMRLSGRVGAKTSGILQNTLLHKDYIIKNINDLDWDSFDTLILGHTEELLTLVREEEFKDKLILQALDKNKQIYSFDDLEYLSDHIKAHQKEKNIYWPQVDNKYPIANRFGKLYSSTKPILGVCGTQSRQGKCTLQLYLRKQFLKDGYNIGQIGTEPNALLFGMDYVYHNGYKTNIKASIEESVYALNNMIWDISEKDVDLIIVGSQAGIVPYNTYNTQNYSFIHQIFLQAVRPDAVLLCFNYYDEISFIKRTVNVIEGLVDCKVIGLVCFPMKFGDNWAGIVGAKERITKDEEYKIKYEVSKALDRPVYILGNAEDMNAAYECCTNYFSS